MGFPFGEIFYIAISIAIVYYITIGLLFIVFRLCNRNVPAFMPAEGFANESELTLAYYSKLEQRANAILKRCEAANGRVQTIRDRYKEMDTEICEVSRQIDDGILQNYMSNVPEDEYKLPADIQKQRSVERKKRADAFVKTKKDEFSASYKSKLLECFANEFELSSRRDEVFNLVNSADSAVATLGKNIEQLVSELSPDAAQRKYATLAYNDFYIKQLKKSMENARKTEGFESPTTEILTFRPSPAPPQQDPSQEMGLRLSKLEETLGTFETGLNDSWRNLTIFTNTIKLQSDQLKQVRSVAKTP